MTDRSLDPSAPLTRYFNPAHYGITKSASAVIQDASVTPGLPHGWRQNHQIKGGRKT